MSRTAHSSAKDSSHWDGKNNQGSGIWSDGKSIYVPAAAMNITWGSDERFWKRVQLPKSDLPKDVPVDASAGAGVAELIQVNWLEARGSVDLAAVKPSLPSGRARYEVVFHVKFKVDAFGWSNSPVTLVVTGPGGQREIRKEMMESCRRKGGGRWYGIHGGEFAVAAAGNNSRVDFAMLDVDNSWWKGGLVFAGVTIRPKQT